MAAQQVGLSDEMEQCVDSCTEAVEVCEWCAEECADHGEGMAECIRLCRDVADIAPLCARLCTRGSDFNSQIAEACAQACEACAEECESHDHEHCQVCGRSCPSAPSPAGQPPNDAIATGEAVRRETTWNHDPFSAARTLPAIAFGQPSVFPSA